MNAIVKSDWKGGDAYVIGGGSSLRSFNFDLLKGRNTIGANDAFRLGPSVCNRVLFADHKWWRVYKWELETYAKAGGIVYSICPDNERLNIPWLHQLYRGPKGLSVKAPVIGWNCNSGAAAVNLALLLGAKRVFLLGFDMQANPDSLVTHWHNHRSGPTPQQSYNRFMRGFKLMAAQLPAKFPGAEIINVTDGTSRMETFRKIGFKDLKWAS